MVNPEQIDKHKYTFQVATEDAGMRLDKYITRRMPASSRSFLGKLIKRNNVQVDGVNVKAGYKLQAGTCINIILPQPIDSDLIPTKIPFDILFEDESILVVAKPPGIVVHPGAGNEDNTLVHGLLYHCGNLPGLDKGRPGIVHRLDKNTSGIILIAKTEIALRTLSADFKQRRILKQYNALLLRSPHDKKGRLVAPLGRHPVNRKKIAIRPRNGKYAATGWEIIEHFNRGLCWAKIYLETGRTHQIRVHMASIGCPVAGDSLYGGKVPASYNLQITRQFLHASTLTFTHPKSGNEMSFTAPIWPDIQNILNQLRSED